LPAQWKIETVGMSGSLYVRYRRSFAQHLQDRVAGDEMDQEEYQRDDQPDYRQHVENAKGEVAEHSLVVDFSSLALGR